MHDIADGSGTPNAAEPARPPARAVLGMRVDATSLSDSVDRIMAWAQRKGSRYVCVANVSSVMQARGDPAFLRLMNEADLVTPDGMPLVWGLRLLGLREVTRVRGPDLLPALLKASSRTAVPVGFFGSTDAVLEQLGRRVRERTPAVKITYSKSPPFREETPEEDARTVEEINSSGARLLFVGLGCPKQERWMAEHRETVDAVMVGVAAAFDFLAGSKSEAPRWMQRTGLEWLFRLATEPRRLWRRYLFGNTSFVVLFGRQLIRERLLHRPPDPQR